MPTQGQKINLKVTSVDGQNAGAGIYPVGLADLTYTIGASNAFSIASTNADSYFPSPNAASYTASGDVVGPTFPAVPPVSPSGIVETSIITFTPSDWMQKATKQAALASVNGVYTTTVSLEAKGKLPTFLAANFSQVVDYQNDAILANFNVTITRLPNAPETGVANACQYKVTLARPDIKTNEVGAIASYNLLGDDLAPLYLDEFNRQNFELYMPMLSGTFATSKDVPLVPVRSDLTHTYGVSSDAPRVDTLTSGGTLLGPMALQAELPTARQIIVFDTVQ